MKKKPDVMQKGGQGKKRWLTIVLFTALTFVLMIGCKTQYPACIEKDKNELTDLKITWGDENYVKGETNGFMLDSKGYLHKITISRGTHGLKDEELNKIDPEKYCSILRMIRQKILITQALNAPGGEVSRFIEYNNPTMRMYTKGVWNPIYQTVGSAAFREVYDTLQTIVPKEG